MGRLIAKTCLSAGHVGRKSPFLTPKVGQNEKLVSVERLELSTNGLKGQ
jgi:hypothetical protein